MKKVRFDGITLYMTIKLQKTVLKSHRIDSLQFSVNSPEGNY